MRNLKSDEGGSIFGAAFSIVKAQMPCVRENPLFEFRLVLDVHIFVFFMETYEFCIIVAFNQSI